MKYIKKFIIFSFLLFFFSFSFVNAATLSDLSDTSALKKQNTAFIGGTGVYSNTSTSIGDVIAMVIKGFLSLLGIIFLIILVIAGFKYMNARGNEDEVKTALSMIRHAIIGLVIVASAYAITAFVFSSLDDGSGSDPISAIVN